MNASNNSGATAGIIYDCITSNNIIFNTSYNGTASIRNNFTSNYDNKITARHLIIMLKL